ncbi:JCAD disease, partial [Nothocercus julius]|nr:JCAD disease [Nothocercus julius]
HQHNMFSVEDLLISHGYKLSKNPPVSYENRYDGCQREITGTRPGQRVLNGFETESRASAYSKRPLAKSNSSSTESSHGSQGRQAGPGYHHGLQGLSTFHTSEGGVDDKPQLTWSSQPKTDKDLAYWRRRGQDFSVLLGYSHKGGSEMKGPSPAHGAPRHAKESQLKVGAGPEYARSGLQESCKVPSDCKWQSFRMESWNEPKRIGRQMSDGDREKLLEDLYTLTLGDNVLTTHNKGKSQSLPRVLSPESLRCVEMPSLTNSNSSLSGTRTPSYPPKRITLESSKHQETGGHFLPLAKPKYGRPLKPPSYELQRQTRTSAETSAFQDHYQKNEPVSYLAKVNEPRQDGCIQDSALEPPVYVPPPSYKSPPHQSVTPHSLSEVPNSDAYATSDQQNTAERAATCQRPATNAFETVGEPCKDNHLSHGKQSHIRHPADYLRSVQYIPFDDPRIRHIKIAPPEGLQENTKYTENACNPSSGTSQDRHLGVQYNSAFLDASNFPNSVKGERTSDSSTHSNNRWLAPSVRDQENCALSDQRDSCSTTNHSPRNEGSAEYTKGKLFVRHSHMDSTCETVTKVKKFEPGTGMQSKKSSKKKMNETIFCLVSIPVKSESNLPDTDRNNNITQSPDKNGFDNNGALQEQSLLSMSSTDLELQALTGNMTNKNELQKQELWRPEEFKQMNDLRFIQPTKHRELKYSGSWPGDQYKDQQTQTSFTEEPKSPQFFHGIKPGQPSSNKTQTAKLTGCTASTIGSKQPGSPSDERTSTASAYSMKGQTYLSQSSNSAFSRTAISVPQAPLPKAHQSQPSGPSRNTRAQERETSLVSKSEVVKGEASAPCNSKELFGQFLLKPVSRRPWDVISELESFNKELQEQEESTSSEEDSESAGASPQECGLTKRRPSRNEKSNWERRHGGQMETVVPDVPVFKSGRVKSKSESWSMGTEYGDQQSSVGSLQPRESSEVVRPADGSLITEMRKEEAKSSTNKQLVSVGPLKRVLSSSPSSSCHESNPFNNADLKEMNEYQNYLEFVRPNKSTTPRNDTVLERGTIARLSLTKRNQGHSEPDLRSVGLDTASGPSVNNSDHSANVKAVEIPPNESLQDRAARILGIEIAVESLLPDDRVGLHSGVSPANGVQDFDSPVGSTVSGQEGKKDSSYEGRRKCGWTESALFVGDGGRSLYPDECETTDQETSAKTEITKQGFEQPAGPSQGEDQNLSCKSAAYQHSEKRVRSTSKVIETLQGKLTSPPSRTAMDRLVRMKEVDSVSRMRRLSIKSADSVEDVDEEKLSRVQEERGIKSASSGAVSKRVISLSENGYLGGMDKKIGRDVCL